MKNIATIILLVFSQIILAQRTYSPAPPPAVDRNADLPLSIIKVYENPTEVAEFPQGINIFRDKFNKMIVISSFENATEKTFKTIVSFVVERNGSISDVQAKGTNAKFNNEVIKAVRSLKDKWKPAKYKGETVRSRFRIPVMIAVD
ncbi:energy transducer TonB [Chryseobacterium foetidum]|uniref:energy transducer TonB n=1 Tax=Chryseobacterium foetidum TaxID=2951057 RepID=UPI0021C5C5E4|nr:energy transducer TonB [Chryseobacterium foetidum]